MLALYDSAVTAHSLVSGQCVTELLCVCPQYRKRVNILKRAYCPIGEKTENSHLPSYQYFAF